MASIGGWYLKRIPTLNDENVRASYSANYLRPDSRPLGGKLYLTNHRVVFTPHLLDSWLGGETYECRLRDVVSVDSIEPVEQGANRRLQITIDDDHRVEFVVHKVERARERIDNAVADRISQLE